MRRQALETIWVQTAALSRETTVFSLNTTLYCHFDIDFGRYGRDSAMRPFLNGWGGRGANARDQVSASCDHSSVDYSPTTWHASIICMHRALFAQGGKGSWPERCRTWRSGGKCQGQAVSAGRGPAPVRGAAYKVLGGVGVSGLLLASTTVQSRCGAACIATAGCP